MTASSTTRYDVEALKNRAGGTVFARGEASHRDGRARLLSVEPARVLAVVEGSQVSRSANLIPTVLTRSAPEFSRQSQPAKFRFPDREMERPKQRLSAFR